MENFGLPLAALIISAGTLIFGAISLRQKASTSYVESLEEQVKLCQAETKELRKAVEECHHNMRTLRDENIELMRKLVGG